jgi:heptosyltransferase I
MATPRNVLIILMGSLGDVVRGLSLVDQLKRNFPGVKVSWLIEPKCEELVRRNDQIDEVLVFDRQNPLKGIRALRRRFRELNFDVVLDLQRHFKSGFLSWSTRAARRIGFHRKNAKEFNWVFNTEYIEAADEESVSKLSHYLSFLKRLGGEVKEPIRFGIKAPNCSEAIAEIKRQAGQYLVLILGSSWESKNWPLEGYSNLIARLVAGTHYGVVLVGDSSHITFAESLLSGAKSDRVINAAGKTSLPDLLSLLEGAVFCIGPDSGPMHMAGALSVPYVSLFGPTSSLRVAPYGSEDLVIQSPVGCSPCYRRRCPGLNKVCMRLISAEQVFALASRVIAEARTSVEV